MKNSQKFIFFIVCVNLLLSGCVSTGEITRDQEVKKEKGVILASISSSIKKSPTNISFYFQKAGEKREIGMFQEEPGSFSKPINDFPDDPNRRGRLLAFEVDPGNYNLTKWKIYAFTGAGHKYIEPKEPKPLPFIVKPGEITYLGNLHVDIIYGENMFGFSIPAGGLSSIDNRADVDLQLLKDKYPNIRNWPIVISIPDRSQWKI